MKTLTQLAVLSLLSLGGCTTPFRAPTEVAHIILERGDSKTVRVTKLWLERKHGTLAARGLVTRRLDATDTSRTHLDVTLFDARGRILRATKERFQPQQIPPHYRTPADATYSISLEPLPSDTARIRVQAHEGHHS